MTSTEAPSGPCVVIVVDTTISFPWPELFRGYLVRYMQLLHEKLYGSNVRWSTITLQPESALYNNPITIGECKPTRLAIPEVASLIPPPNVNDKGKAPQGRQVPLLDGLVAALEMLDVHSSGLEPKHILLLTSSDIPCLDCVDQGSLDGFTCSYNASPKYDGYGYQDLASELRSRSISLSLITTQYLPRIEGFQREVSSNETISPVLKQIMPALNSEHSVTLSGISTVLEQKGRKATGDVSLQPTPFSNAPLLPSSSTIPSTSAASTVAAPLYPTQLPAGPESALNETSIQLLTPQGSAIVNTATMSIADLQKLKLDLSGTVKSLADRLHANVREGKVDTTYAKRIYESIVQKASKQSSQLDAFINSKKGTPVPGITASPHLPQPSANTAQQQQNAPFQQPLKAGNPVKTTQPNQPTGSIPQLLWSGPLVHHSYDQQTGQRKEMATMLEVYPSSRTSPSDFAGVQWPQKLEFNKTFPLEGASLQAFVTSNNIPIVNLAPVSAANLVRTKFVQDMNTAQVIERVYSQFAAGLASSKSLVFIPFGPSANNGLLIMAGGSKLAGLFFGKTPLPEYLLRRQPQVQQPQRQMNQQQPQWS